MLGWCWARRWTNVNPTLVQCLLLHGRSYHTWSENYIRNKYHSQNLAHEKIKQFEGDLFFHHRLITADHSCQTLSGEWTVSELNLLLIKYLGFKIIIIIIIFRQWKIKFSNCYYTTKMKHWANIEPKLCECPPYCPWKPKGSIRLK